MRNVTQITHAEKWAEEMKTKEARIESQKCLEEIREREKEMNKYLTYEEIKDKNERNHSMDMTEHGSRD